MGFNTDFFPLLFCVPRCAGWLSHWYEFQDDPDNRILRPFQIYQGPEKRDIFPLDQRTQTVPEEQLKVLISSVEKRRLASSDGQKEDISKDDISTPKTVDTDDTD